MKFGSHRRTEPPEVGQLCAVADSNLTRAEDAILARPAPTPGPARTSWDHRRLPVRLDRIARRFHLNPEEQRRLMRDGLVVLARLEQPSYGWAYHEIYQSQLPVFISVDSILHAVYAAHDGLVAGIERRELVPLLGALLSSLHCALPAAATRYPADTAHDLDVYLVVARTLLGGKPVASVLGDSGVEQEATALVKRARAAEELTAVELFGRARIIDFTQYAPRGHYRDELVPYFQAVMWLSRLEFNLVSRSSRSSAPGQVPDPRETPREAVDALALADLIRRSGAGESVERFDRLFTLLAGRREDIALPVLSRLAGEAGIADLRAATAAEKLRAQIGDRFQRTARIHYMPPGAPILPAIATLLGPRISADAAALRPLAHDETPDRLRLHGGDLAYVLGSDRGRRYLEEDLAAYPRLGSQLDKARAALAAAPRSDDLYAAWLDAIRALASPPPGTVPSFMQTPAFADLRLDSMLAAFAQLRHNHVLLDGQAFGVGGCEIPDGYVEPAPAVYEAIARYADLGARGLTGLTSADANAYFVRLAKLARVLAAISRLELANQPLPIEAQRFLSMVTEILPYGSDGRPTYTGWYFDLFADRTDAIAHPELIADFFTSTAGVGYLGVTPPQLGLFVVDTGGGPRVVVGPVAHAYEHQGGSGRRLDDDAARALPAAAVQAPWTQSYTAAAPPAPFLILQFGTDSKGASELAVTTQQPLGIAVFELLDHHRAPLVRFSRRLGQGKTSFRINWPDKAEMVHVQVGAYKGWAELLCLEGCLPIKLGVAVQQEPAEEPSE